MHQYQAGSRNNAMSKLNLNQIRHNLVLKHITLNRGCTRHEAAVLSGLDKNTVNQIINDWINWGILKESSGKKQEGKPTIGRTAVSLHISETAPLIGGMLLKRGLLSAIIGTLDGTILKQQDYAYSMSQVPDFIGTLCTMFEEIRKEFNQPIIGIGISSIGPVDLIHHTISPAYFFGITNFPICQLVQQRLSIPTYLINDANAGALTEKMWGAGKNLSDFLYIHIMNGIGAGLILDGRLHNGATGKSGEIGHTSINAFGPICDCGNRGCLDLYTSMDSLNRRIEALEKTVPVPTRLPQVEMPNRKCSWSELLEACDADDPLALTTLDEFCSHLTVAVNNMLKILDISTLIIGYEAGGRSTVLEEMIEAHLSTNMSPGRKITVSASHFREKSPLYGSLAVVCDKVFEGKILLCH